MELQVVVLDDLRRPPLLAGVDDDGHQHGRRPRAQEVVRAELVVHASRAAHVHVLEPHPHQPEPQAAILQDAIKRAYQEIYKNNA